MKKLRIVLWGFVVAAAMIMTYFLFFDGLSSQSRLQADGVKLGGAFNLVRHDGEPISDKDMLGKPHAIFFGFTNCPEVCPTSLFEITTWLDKLGKDAKRIGVYFVSVDPERDSVELLSEYLTSFSPQIVGVTGKKEEVEKVLRAYKVFFQRVKLEDGDYTMDHTATIYLMNGKGEFVRSIAYGEDSNSAVKKLKLMLNLPITNHFSLRNSNAVRP